MVRLSEILRKEELSRVNFEEHKPLFLDKLSNVSSAVVTDEGLYKELLNLMRQALSDILEAKPLDLTLLKDKLNLLIEFVSKDDGSLLKFIDRYDDLEDYLVVHGVNVCILSLEIGRGLNYNRQMMLDLGLGAFLHDIGMLKVKNILDNRRQLYTAEYEEVKEHVNYGTEMLKNLGQTDNKLSAIITQHHERKDGSGYLKGLKAQEIDECSQIVGLADVYEALIHSRPYRNKYIPFEYETIKELISNREMFDPYILKVFLERITRNPAYILWLATSGIYEMLEQQIKTSQTKESKEIKPAGKSKKRFVLTAAIWVIALMGMAILLLPRIHTPSRDVFYPLGSSLGISADKLPLKIAYNFNGISDIQSASLNLAGINLEGYHFLSFSFKLDDKITKKMRYATLKINVENARKEVANYYVQGMSNKWQEFRIPLSYFDSIKDWSMLNSVSFILQPWNIDGKEGTLYIDNIHFYRKK